MKLIEVITDENNLQPVTSIAEQHHSEVNWVGSPDMQCRQLIRILVNNENRQSILDALQGLLGESSKILVLPLEAVLPRKEPDPSSQKVKETVTTTREELYSSIVKNAHIDSTYLLLVFLSTIVVAIGLFEDNVAVVIGAMVIAPLLGPNIALALGAALGDMALMWKATKTTITGITLALSLSIILGLIYPLNLDSH